MDIVIFGTGEVAEVIYEYLRTDSNPIAAFTVDREYITEPFKFDIPVVPFDELVKRYPPKSTWLCVAMSFRGINAPRAAKVAEVEALGYKCIGFIHSTVHEWEGFRVEPNTFILDNNVIQPHTTIGKNCIVWSGNHIGHHTHIGDNVFIASHAVISGHVTIGDNTFIGVNATIRDGITIGKRCVIGAGALVLLIVAIITNNMARSRKYQEYWF